MDSVSLKVSLIKVAKNLGNKILFSELRYSTDLQQYQDIPRSHNVPTGSEFPMSKLMEARTYILVTTKFNSDVYFLSTFDPFTNEYNYDSKMFIRTCTALQEKFS